MVSVFGGAATAEAGIDACNNIRLEDVSECELKLSADCTAGCSEFGIYKTSCATKLVTVCNETCTLDADATCTDECTVMCDADCDAGINVICVMNCFDECTAGREASCADAADVEQCEATFNATCDNKCDDQCAPVVDASCYQHCIECCGGSCNALANMDCQTSCQDVQFEECEQEFRANCEASCDLDGALFCDGEYILSGSTLDDCLAALIAEGIGGLEAEGEVTIGPDGIDADGSAGFCSSSRGQAAAGAPLALLLAAVGFRLRRRKSRTSKRTAT